MENIDQLLKRSIDSGTVSGTFGLPPHEEFTASDDENHVEMTITGDARPVAARLLAPWPSSIHLEVIEAAALRAFTAAHQLRMEKWRLQVAEARAETSGTVEQEPTTAPDPFMNSLAAFAHPHVDMTEAISRMGALMQEFLREARAVTEQRINTVQDESSAVSGGVEVAVGNDGVLKSVHIDPYWARQRRSSEISSHLTDALREAARPSHANEQASSSRMTHMLGLMQDPYLLAHELGLTRRATP